MKLLDVFAMINESQFLVERDVINAKELKAWAKESAARLTDPQAATWYASQLSKYLINRYEAGLKTAQFDAQAPDWVMAKLDAGEQIYTVEPQQELRQQAEQVIDWLNAMTAENSSPNLRMTWEDAVEAQHEWHRDIARQSRVTELTAEQMGGIVTIMEFEDGFRWVDVQTEVCLQHEGTVMGHCVGQGGYTQGVKEGTLKILSLRDGNNNPHATIEGRSEHPIHITPEMLNSGQLNLFVDNALEVSFVDLSINQIKGKENKAVVRKYRDYVQDFLTKFQIETFGYGGLDDLENSGLFKLRKGGYVNVEEIGEHVAKMDDGSVWHRVDGEYVELKSYHGDMVGKWYLYDKNGRSIGSMAEEIKGVIDRISFVSNTGYNLSASEKEKYKKHIVTAFNTKYDKGRMKIGPDSGLYNGFYNTLEGFGLGVDGMGKVNEPQTIGKLKVKTGAGDVYATNGGQQNGDMYWLMNGDKIKARFRMNLVEERYGVIFDNNRGIPSGSMPKFLKEFSNSLSEDINISHIQLQDRNILVSEMEWSPDKGDEFILEEDGVKFYKTAKGWYNAVDGHNHLIFNMHNGDESEEEKFELDSERLDGSTITSPSFKLKMVSDKRVAGYYAVYLINHLDLETGYYSDYSSFARELLNETSWFEGQRSNTWYVLDPTFKIHLTITDSYDDDTEEDAYDDDTTMETYWNETGLQDSGMEEDYFASEYEQVYRGGNIGWDDDHWGDDQPDVERQRVRVDYYVEGIGDADTVTHPVSDGSVRIAL